MKWLVYDGVENMVVVSHSNDFVQLVFATFVVGSISAVSGSLTKDFGSAIEKKIDNLKIEKEKEINTVLLKTKKIGINSKVEMKSMKTNTKLSSEAIKTKSSKISTTFIQTDNNPYIREVLFRYCTSAIEGGVLFASYQIVTKFVTMIIPENYNMKFVFNQVIEEIEREIDPDIV